jgi:hypothetical protein
MAMINKAWRVAKIALRTVVLTGLLLAFGPGVALASAASQCWPSII